MDANTQLLLGLLAMLSSFGGVLVWLVKRFFEKDERQTDRFLNTMDTIVSKNTESQQQMAATVSEVRNGMTELSTTVREMIAANREEHRAMMDALGKAAKARDIETR